MAADGGAPPPPPPMQRRRRAPAKCRWTLSPRERQIIQPDPNGGGGQPARPGADDGLHLWLELRRALRRAWQGLPTHTRSSARMPVRRNAMSSTTSSSRTRAGRRLRQPRRSARPRLGAASSRAEFEAGLKPFDASLDRPTRVGGGPDRPDRRQRSAPQLDEDDARSAAGSVAATGRAGCPTCSEIERELARVQARYRLAASPCLAALKLRVAMSVMTLSYTAEIRRRGSESVWRPVGDAFGDFMPNFATTLAGIVEFIGEPSCRIVVFGLMPLAGWSSLFRRRAGRKKAAGCAGRLPRQGRSGGGR